MWFIILDVVDVDNDLFYINYRIFYVYNLYLKLNSNYYIFLTRL